MYQHDLLPSDMLPNYEDRNDLAQKRAHTSMGKQRQRPKPFNVQGDDTAPSLGLLRATESIISARRGDKNRRYVSQSALRNKPNMSKGSIKFLNVSMDSCGPIA